MSELTTNSLESEVKRVRSAIGRIRQEFELLGCAIVDPLESGDD